MVHRFAIAELEVHGGTAVDASARIVLTDADNGKVEATGTGNGMIDAAMNAGVGGERHRRRAARLPGLVGDERRRRARRGRGAARGRRPRRDGRGVATDVVEASARAYLNAVNKIVRLQERGVPAGARPHDGPVVRWAPSSIVGSSRRGRRTISTSVIRLPHRAEGHAVLRELVAASTPITRVLDVGTGDGYTLGSVLLAYPDATGVGIDFSPEMLDRGASALR